ncbi:MAG: [LysW]-lysine hydrolase [Planctomycetota bacterium]
MNAVEFLTRLVATESVSGEEAEAAELSVRRMAQLGLEARVDEAGNAVGVRRGPRAADGAEHTVVLLGHIDTVPGRIPVRVEDGKLFGRGAVDAKGPFAAFIEAVARTEPQAGTSFVVVGAVEEESATSKGARHVAPLYRPDACLIGEPSGWDAVTVGYKGRLLVDYRAEQPGGHSAGPEGAVAERATRFWSQVSDRCARFNAGKERLFERVLPSLRSIHTDSDGLTDRVAATLGFRLPPDFDVPAFEAELEGLAPGASVRVFGREPAWTSPRTTPLARSLARAIREHGARPRFLHKTGTSDMNVLGPAWGCPIAAYGPGDSLLDHTPNEHLDLFEFERSIDVLAGALAAG